MTNLKDTGFSMHVVWRKNNLILFSLGDQEGSARKQNKTAPDNPLYTF